MMGEMADLFTGWDERDERPCPEDFLDMSDDELRHETRRSRDPKITGIRSWEGDLSPKQRYCLAVWIADHEDA